MSQGAERERRRAERERARDVPADAPSPEVSRAAIQDLVDIWPESPVVTVKPMDDAYLRTISIWVFAEHAVRTAKAVLVLDEQRMYMQCGPLARMVYECGVTAVWMVKTPKSGHTMFKGAKKAHDLLMEGFANMAGVPVPEDDEDAMTGLEDAEQPPKLWQRAKFLDGGKWIYPYYRFLSAFSHGEGSLIQEYLEEKDAGHAWGHRIQFRDPEEFRWRHVVLALTVVMLNFALLAWDQVSEQHGLREPLARIAKKHLLNSYPFTASPAGNVPD